MFRRPSTCGLVIALTLVLRLFFHSSVQAAALDLKLIVSGQGTIVSISNAHDNSNRLFLVRQAGVILILKDGAVLPTNFLDISSRVLSGGEQGLLGLTFDPNYASNGFFYVYYTSQPAGQVTISRFHVSADPNVADAASEMILKTQDHPNFTNHNGGSLLFGPDGCLYAGIGDGGSGGDPNNNAQNLGTLLGKIIRISAVDGSPCAAAPGNPFVGTPGAKGEIWALGLRNPWRIAMDRMTGDFLIADVGQDKEEEVDFQPPGVAGNNYCWRHKEGLLIFDASTPCTTGTPTDPVLVYDHVSGNCAIIGGYRYRGSQLNGLFGKYFFADLCSGQIWTADNPGGNWASTPLLSTNFNIGTFGEDEAGEIYFADLSSGSVYKFINPHSRDFDGDGKSDVLWRDTGGDAAIWFMNGNQIVSGSGLGNVSTAWTIVGSGDFDGDGHTDILWRNSTGDLAVWFMNGNQIVSGSSLGNVPTAWTVAGIGDFDDDGRADILWRNANGDLTIWFMHGAQIASGVSLGNVQTVWSVAGVGDFDGNGKRDILWRANNGNLTIWFMNGSQIVSSAGLGNVDPAWSVAGVRDFDGNGTADILWRDTAGDVAMWLMSGGQILSGQSLGNVPTVWSIVQTTDFNGDGKSDILWRSTGGMLSMWLMNGAQITSGSGLGTVPTAWSVQNVSAN